MHMMRKMLKKGGAEIVGYEKGRLKEGGTGREGQREGREWKGRGMGGRGRVYDVY